MKIYKLIYSIRGAREHGLTGHFYTQFGKVSLLNGTTTWRSSSEYQETSFFGKDANVMSSDEKNIKQEFHL